MENEKEKEYKKKLIEEATVNIEKMANSLAKSTDNPHVFFASACGLMHHAIQMHIEWKKQKNLDDEEVKKFCEIIERLIEIGLNSLNNLVEEMKSCS